ncbi:MAG: response regulator transcription factor [Chitinophagaceae bacterium]|nr:response regulator transcription factor [Chitinophagaceae bacterium]
MIKTILVEDEPRGMNTLRNLLQEYCPEVEVIAESMDTEDAKKQIASLQPELVFMDISLPGKTSFEMLKEMRDIAFEIIFVTAHHQYALQAFRYSAVDYLTKPLDEDLLADAVRRAARKISVNAGGNNLETLLHNLQCPNAHHEMKLCIPSLKGFQVIGLKDILYCEASGSYTNLHFAGQPPVCSARPIHEYEEMLSRSNFVRIHKSYLVNLSHVKEYLRGEGGSVVLSNNQEIEVSRRKKEIFLNEIKKYYRFLQ